MSLLHAERGPPCLFAESLDLVGVSATDEIEDNGVEDEEEMDMYGEPGVFIVLYHAALLFCFVFFCWGFSAVDARETCYFYCSVVNSVN